MYKPFKSSKFRSKFEGVASGIVFAATTVLFVGTALAEFIGSGLVA